MKTKNLFLAALATLAFVSCADSEFVGDNSPNDLATVGDGSINFGFDLKSATRADLYGSDAAAKLGNKFVVYGTKHASAEDNTAANDAVVFNNFQVAWTASTAGTTASNSSDWEYVGLQAYEATPTSQGIKYWDYSADNGYTFYAFSSSNLSYPKKGTNRVSVTKLTSDGSSLYNKGYSVVVTPGAELDKLYFSDRVPVPKGDYGKTVSLTFRNIGAKVRVGFYETIPGYSVKIDKFYVDDDATAVVTAFSDMNVGKADGFHAALQNVNTAANQSFNVYYYNATTATETINRPKVSNTSSTYVYDLALGSGVVDATTLSDNSASPTWDKAAGAYTYVFPFEGNTNPMLLKLDFTLTATDGSNDVIKVRGARAIVPAKYVQWKSNFAYTYIFKISDMTNGTTGDVDVNGDPVTDPEGLKPITFDAIVVDVAEELQETITTVETNSITTYAEGAVANEYAVDSPIYVSIVNNGVSGRPVITPSAIGTAAGNAQVYSLNKAATEAEVLAQLTGSPMGITLTAVDPAATIESTVPLVDGTTPSIANVMFTPDAAGYYAYVYTRTAYVAPGYTIQTSETYDNTETYYMLSGSGAYYAVSVPNEAAFDENKAHLYLKTSAGTPGVYDVKVIKVQ